MQRHYEPHDNNIGGRNQVAGGDVPAAPQQHPNETTLFRESMSFERRRRMFERIIQQYPDRVPVIVERAPRCALPPLAHTKFMVPKTTSVGQLVCEVRKGLHLDPATTIYIFVGNTQPSAHVTLCEVYARHKEDDGFLYMRYDGDNAFGAIA